MSYTAIQLPNNAYIAIHRPEFNTYDIYVKHSSFKTKTVVPMDPVNIDKYWMKAIYNQPH